VLPSFVTEGVWGLAVAGLTVLTVVRSRNPLLAMLVGMLVVFAARKMGR